MIAIALLLQNNEAELPAALIALQRITADGTPLVLIDQGSQDRTTALAHAFIAKESAGRLIKLSKTVSLSEASELTQTESGADFALVLTPQDRLCRTAFAELQNHLAHHTEPKRIALRAGWWVSSAEAMIPPHNAQREAFAALQPDTALILHKRGELPSSGSDQLGNWAQFATEAEGALISPHSTVLRHITEAQASGAFLQAQKLVAVFPQHLELALHWASAALALSVAREVDTVLSEASEFLIALNHEQTTQIQTSHTLAGQFLATLLAEKNSEALARFAICSAMRQDAILTALQSEYVNLRADLTAALPGPNYLLTLHRELLAR